MKVLKFIAIMMLVTLSAAYAENPEVVAEVMQNGENMISVDATIPQELDLSAELSFLDIMLKFLASGLLAFVLSISFPKFFKKTNKILLEKGKLKILGDALLTSLILLLVMSLGFLSVVGSGIAAIVLGVILIIYSMSIPVFSMGVLEWVYQRKNIKFDKLSKVNKLISLLSINLIIMVFVLPLYLMIPATTINLADGEIKVNLIANAVVSLFSLFGMGMITMQIKETLKKNKKKL